MARRKETRQDKTRQDKNRTGQKLQVAIGQGK